MRLTWHSSACFSVESNDTKVLFDPWLESFAFLGSWAQWPPVKDTKEIVFGTKYEYIVYTHFHSDHFDARFLSAYLKTMKLINHKPTILVAENSWNQLSNSIINIAGESANIKRIPSGEKFGLNSENFSITLYCSDHCEPVLCGKAIPCFSNNPKFRSIDSVALIEDSTSSIINFNDAISSNLDVHLQKMGKQADLIMGVFSAAGSFPQCQTNFSKKDIEIAKEKFIDGALRRLTIAAERLRAKYIFPFAGQYILVGDLSKLNDDRAVLPVSSAKIKLTKLTDKIILTLNPNENLTLENGELCSLGAEYVEPFDHVKDEYLFQHKELEYFYERRNIDSINLKSLEQNLELASQKISKIYDNNLEYTILLTDKTSNFRWFLNFGETLTWGKNLSMLKNYSKIVMDLRLLDSCVKKTTGYSGFTSMHWNQAHIGSHLMFHQTEYSAPAHYLLNFLHT